MSSEMTSVPSVEDLQGFLSATPRDQLDVILKVHHLFALNGKDDLKRKLLKPLIIPHFIKLLEGKDTSVMVKVWIVSAFGGIISRSSCTYASDVVFGNEQAVILQILAQLDSSDAMLRGQVLCTLEKISESRDMFSKEVFYAEDLHRVVKTLREDRELRARGIATQVLTILCQGMGPRLAKRAHLVLPVLGELMKSSDEMILGDAVHALRIFSVSKHDISTTHKIQDIVGSGVCPRLVELLSHDSAMIRYNALVVVYSITNGDDTHISKILSCGVLSALPPFFSSQDPNVVSHICWLLRNVLKCQLARSAQGIIDAGLVPLLVGALKHPDKDGVRCPATKALVYVAKGANEAQVHYLVSQGIIRCICSDLTNVRHALPCFALEGLKNILEAGEMGTDVSGRNISNRYAPFVEETGVLGPILKLHASENASESIKQLAGSILLTYFIDDDAE